MKTICLLLFSSLLCLMVNAQKITPGAIWPDNNGIHINTHGGGIIFHISELTDNYLDHTGRYIRVAPAEYNEAPTIF